MENPQENLETLEDIVFQNRNKSYGAYLMQFVVGQDGSITKVDVLKGIGFGCDEEAQRVVKLMPHWSPEKQSGRPVAVRYTLPISFQLSE